MTADLRAAIKRMRAVLTAIEKRGDTPAEEKLLAKIGEQYGRIVDLEAELARCRDLLDDDSGLTLDLGELKEGERG